MSRSFVIEFVLTATTVALCGCSTTSAKTDSAVASKVLHTDSAGGLVVAPTTPRAAPGLCTQRGLRGPPGRRHRSRDRPLDRRNSARQTAASGTAVRARLVR